jgi:hypothetical protein
MNEKKQWVKVVARWVAIAVFVVFVIPTALGFFIIRHRQAALKDSTAVPSTIAPDSVKAPAPAIESAPVNVDAPVKVRTPVPKDTTHG